MTQQYTEFCCKLGGSNLHAGTLNGDSIEPGTSASFTYTGATWVAATGVLTVASGNPQADGVAVGNWASLYRDGASPPTDFIGRITARNTTTITVSVTAGSGCCGTVPTDGTSNTTIKIGGAWAGPSGTSGFPLNFGTGAGNAQQKQFLKDSTGRFPRLNIKNDQIYHITNAARGGSPALDGIVVPQNSDKMCTFQGYTVNYGDLGQFIIDGGTTGTNYTLVNFANPSSSFVKDMIVQNNGDSGLIHHIDLFMGNGGDVTLVRCVGRHAYSRGLAEVGNLIIESETYDCNQYADHVASGIGGGAFDRSNCFRCITHDSGNPLIIQDRAIAFHLTGGAPCSVASTSVSFGFESGVNVNCDVYRCGAGAGSGAGNQGLDLSQGCGIGVNCNVTKCDAVGYAIDTPASAESITNRYGTGTQANILISDGSPYYVDLTGYPANVYPWVDPTTGNFSIVLTESRNTGLSGFTQIAPGYTGTTAYPDIGAADFPSIGILTNPGMTGGI